MFFEIVKRALSSLARNRTRTTLTLVGISWGVACFVILFAYGDGFKKAIGLGLSHYGNNVTVIWNGQTSMQVGGQRAGRRVYMRMRDVEDVRKGAPLIQRISPEIYRDYPVKSAKRLTNAGVRGVNHEYGFMRGHYLQEGRVISLEDERYGRRVAILGNDLRVKLFSEGPALEQEIKINGVPFTVIGVLQKKVAMSNYFQPDDRCVFIPHTALATMTSTRFLSVMVVQPVNPVMEEQALKQLMQVLGKNHNFDPNDERALLMNKWEMMRGIFGSIEKGMEILLTVIGVITLGIGGVGLMNVMLVSVTERTKEIGLLKALGARRRHIRWQFLLEALVIALFGGFIGYLLAQVVALAIGVIPFWSTVLDDPTRQADIHLIVSARAILTAVVTLGLVGLLSGIFPAIRASKLNPVEALHYE
jgi:putative ABC transport system permease protein